MEFTSLLQKPVFNGSRFKKMLDSASSIFSAVSEYSQIENRSTLSSSDPEDQTSQLTRTLFVDE